jgi:hypothetical protein
MRLTPEVVEALRKKHKASKVFVALCEDWLEFHEHLVWVLHELQDLRKELP